MRTFSRDGLSFRVVDSGPRNGRPVVLLHGFPQSPACWEAVTPLLNARGYRTVAPEQRGYSPGARPRWRWQYRLPDLVGDVVTLVDRLGADKVDLVGHDWGAVVAWATAAWHPDRVRTLSALSVPHPSAMLRAQLDSRQALASWYIWLFQVPWLPERAGSPLRPAARTRLVDALVASGQSRDRAERDVDAMADRTRLTGALQWYRAIPLTPPTRRVGTVTVPTLYVWSDGDRAVAEKAAEGAGRHVSGPYQYVRLEGVSHWVPEEVPRQVADLLDSHLRRHGGRRPARTP